MDCYVPYHTKPNHTKHQSIRNVQTRFEKSNASFSELYITWLWWSSIAICSGRSPLLTCQLAISSTSKPSISIFNNFIPCTILRSFTAFDSVVNDGFDSAFFSSPMHFLWYWCLGPISDPSYVLHRIIIFVIITIVLPALNMHPSIFVPVKRIHSAIGAL